MNNKAPNTGEDEQSLIEQLQRGDETAMKVVFRRYYWQLRYFSFKIINNEPDAEDIVQDAFLNFWHAIKDRQMVPGNIQAYLYRMVRNRSINYLERRQMLDDRSTTVQEHFHEWEARTDEIAMQQELFRRISEKFALLTPIQMQVMELLYIEGLSVAEVASQLNTTANNVRNHKARAVERLQTIFKTAILLLIIFFLIFS